MFDYALALVTAGFATLAIWLGAKMLFAAVNM